MPRTVASGRKSQGAPPISPAPHRRETRATMILPRFTPLLIAISLLALPSVAAAQSTTAFSQLTGAAGCLVSDAFTADDIPSGCAQAPGLTDPATVAVAPGGGQVYVATLSGGTSGDGSSGIAVFNRDAGTG